MHKIRWLWSMYKQGKQKEIEDKKKLNSIQEVDEEDENFENPLEQSKFLEMDDQQFDNEVKELIEWSEQLDFDSYLNEWNMIATSAKSNDFIPTDDQFTSYNQKNNFSLSKQLLDPGI